MNVMVLLLMWVHVDHIRQSVHAVSQKSLSVENFCEHCCLLHQACTVTRSSRCAARAIVDSVMPVTCHIMQNDSSSSRQAALVLFELATAAVTFICLLMSNHL